MILFVVFCVASALADSLPESDLRKMELSTFYADCAVFDDHKLFGGSVCGKDGNTYANCVHLACLNHWRSPKDKVKMVCKGPCDESPPPDFPWCPVYRPVCGKDNKSYCNMEALLLHNEQTGKEVLVEHDGIFPCPSPSVLGVDPSSWEDAVCATNGRTYPSVTAIADMRRFGQCLDVLHDGPCTMDEVKERVTGRAQICDLARNLYEYNPVCDKDGETYANPYILLCFRPNSKFEYMGECESEAHKACTIALAIDKGEKKSPGPVCASDGLTYSSPQHLTCAQTNDKHLFMLHNGTCCAADSPCVTMPPVADCGAPVCGSDGVTYINSHALWCMQRKEDPFLRFFHDGPCFRRCVECSCGCPGASPGDCAV